MSLYEINGHEPFVAPALVTALDGWVDAGGCATTAAAHIADGGDVVVTFDADALIDYRARRPVLDIVGGRMTGVEWLDLSVRRVRRDDRDLLILTGPEPDYRWQEFGRDVVELALHLGVVDSVTLGAIPSTVPHTRPTPVLTTGTNRSPRDTDPPLPAEHMRVPAAGVTLVELNLGDHGIPTAGFWAQVPHYVAGGFSGGALALVERVASHLGVHLSVDELAEEARHERARLDEIVAARPEAQEYLQRLEEMNAPGTIDASADIAAEVERFLRDTAGEDRNPFDDG